MERVLNGPGPGQVIRPPFRLRANPDAARENARQKLALAFALAASLMVFAVGWWAWPTTPETPLRHVVRVKLTPAQLAWNRLRDRHLNKALTLDQKVTGLVDLADKLLVETRGQQGDASHRAQIADHFRFLGDDLVQVVESKIPLVERRALAERARDRLRNVESEAARFKADWRTRHGQPDPSLEQIHEAIVRADRRLRDIVQRVA
jgi:hypothetical protein